MNYNICTLIYLWILTQSILCPPTKPSGMCPIAKVINKCLPKCLSDFDCMGDKRCCVNRCGSTSCSHVLPGIIGKPIQSTTVNNYSQLQFNNESTRNPLHSKD